MTDPAAVFPKRLLDFSNRHSYGMAGDEVALPSLSYHLLVIDESTARCEESPKRLQRLRPQFQFRAVTPQTSPRVIEAERPKRNLFHQVPQLQAPKFDALLISGECTI